jgi:acylphosphatase
MKRPGESNDPDEILRMRVVVRGIVQGVGYRFTTREEARRLNLQGWVRNRVDGSVEVEAEGERRTLDALLAFLRKGPAGAHVESITVEWSEADGEPYPFEVRRSSP